MGLWDAFGIWLAAVFTLGIISFLYKDNIFYKACEGIFVGISAGYWFVTFFWENIWKKFISPSFIDPELAYGTPNYFWDLDYYVPWFGALLGILMLTRLFDKIGWLSRWPLAFIVGATAGLYMMIYFVSNAMVQISATIMPVFRGDIGDIIANLMIVIGTFSGLVYFFFSKEHKGWFGATARLGIWFLMVTFGASFGYTVMSRMSLMIGRIDFLFEQWLGFI